VRTLLAHNADPNQQKPDGTTSLSVASYEAHVDIVRLLLENNADTELARADGTTTLGLASFTGNVEVVEMLLQHNADPRVARHTDGATSLGTAASAGHADVAELLLSHDADPNQQYNDGTTALSIASLVGNAEVARLLLEHNADPTLPLLVASEHGHAEVTRLLLAFGADPNRLMADATAPLLMAAQNGHTGVARLLLDSNANPNYATPDDGATPLLMASQEGHVDVVQLLATFGAVIDRDTRCLSSKPLADDTDATPTPVSQARRNGHDDLAAWLIAVACHHPIQIAVACRLHSAARSALRRGMMHDPTMCSLTDVDAAASGDARWPGLPTPPADVETRRLARAAMAAWSPRVHWLHHPRFREAIHTVFLIRERLERLRGAVQTGTAATTASASNAAASHTAVLPPELWFCICAWLLRRHWVPGP